MSIIMRSFLIHLFFPFCLLSQNRYPVDSIAPSLKENANAVIRLEQTYFEVLDAGTAVLNTRQVVTIFNERGAIKYSKFYIYYDKFDRIKTIKGSVYDMNGNEIYKLKNKDIFDVSYNKFVTDVTDSRIRVAEFDRKRFQYPYTIEFFSSVKTKNLMFYPHSYFYTDEYISLESKQLIVETPPEHDFRYDEENMPGKANIITGKNSKVYIWQVKNIPCKAYEEYTPFDAYPHINTAPKEFKIKEYQGKIQAWNDIAKFYAKLNKGRDMLPEATRLKIKSLVRNEKDTLKIIEILYNYLQNNTRYVSIQLGIGGWQTIAAKDVADKGYGDCKALSNYMKALLNEAGIPSYVALVRAGESEPDIESGFPNFRFNHVINCVPLKNDTIWLECTSQTEAMGYQGSFTGNRKALLILKDGGKLVNTCKYNYYDNTLERVGKITLSENNDAKVAIKTTYRGILQEQKNFTLHDKNSEQQRKFLLKEISLTSFELENFSFIERKSRIPVIEENIDLKVFKLLSNTGSLFFLKPNLLSRHIELPINTQRNMPFYLNPNRFAKMEKDSLIYTISDKYVPEFGTKNISLKSKFGEYYISFKMEEKTLVYTRKLILYSGYYQKNEYIEWIDFIKAVNKNDNITLTFKIKE